MFHPQPFNWPLNRQLRIKDFALRGHLTNPGTRVEDGEPCHVVMKDGCGSGLTVGRHSGLEAYIANDLGVESIELAIYNYNLQSSPFSQHGDSGSLIFDGEGRMLGIIHSGMSKGRDKHITFATPAEYVINWIKERYPYADFSRTSY